MPGPTLLLTEDEYLVAQVGRLAAAAGIDLEVERTPADSLVRWGSSAAVLVGADAAAAACAALPPRRDQIHVVCQDHAPDSLFRQAVALGAASVLELPDAEPWLTELLADLGDGTNRTATTLALVGGSGGVGVTSFAAALARKAADLDAGGGAALVDLDPCGPGLRRVLGWEDGTGVTWPELAGSRGRLGGRALRTALPARDALGVLGWTESVGAARELPSLASLREVVGAARRGHAWVVLDVPRHRCAELLPVLACDHWLVVTRTSLPAVAATSRVVGVLRAHDADVRLVARMHRGGADPTSVARALGAPLAASLGDHRRLDEHLDLGLGPAQGHRNPLVRAAEAVLSSVAGTSMRGDLEDRA